MSRLAGATSRVPRDADGRFWVLQLLFWPAYAGVLMAPWIGVFSVASMLPNKLLIALTGMLAGLGLRPLLATSRWPTLTRLVAVVSVGIAWDWTLVTVVGHSSRVDLERLGSMTAGVPQLSGTFYHVLVVGIWAMAWLLLQPSVTTPAPSDNPVPTVIKPDADHITFRDGRTTHVFGSQEIDWVQADGDYVTIHAAKRRVLVRATLSSTQQMLPSTHYARIHRSAVVRVAFVREIRPRANKEFDVLLRDGTALRASRTYSARVREAIAALTGDQTPMTRG